MTAAEALGCQACGLPITPCLVCASPLPLPQPDDPLFKTCRSCGVVNPLDEKYREVLDIPPASALPSAMVRRAQIARVGRRPYVLAKHAQFMHLSSKKGEDVEDGSMREIFARLGPKGSPVPEIFASAEEGLPLTFLPYMQDTQGSRVHEEAVRSGRKAVDARRLYPFSDSESPVKRMRVPLRQEVDEGEKNLGGNVCSTPQQVPACDGGSAPDVSNGRPPSMFTPLRHDLASRGESTGNTAAAFTAERPIQSSDHRCTTPGTTKCKDGARRDVVDEEVRSTPAGEKTPVSVDPPLETSHRVGIVNQLGASNLAEPHLQIIRSTVNRPEISTPPLENVQRPTSNGSIDQRHKYFEQDFYPQVIVENPDISMSKADGEEVDAHEGEELDAHEENDVPVRDVTGSEEVPTRRHGRACSECGQAGGGSRESVDETELMRCCTQILELHCPHSLRADMRTPCAYPLCCPVPRFPGNSSNRACRSYVTQFTVDMLRAAHSTLTSSTQESTSEEVVSPLRGVEQALSMAETFIEMKDRMVHLQGLIQQVDAASAQASRDFKAYGDHGAFPFARQLIPRLLSREKQHVVDRAKDDVQTMAVFLQDINKLLTTCFQYVGKILETSLCSVGENRADTCAMNLNLFMLDLDSKPGLEAVRTAVPLWLRLYHDVAHASGLLK